MIEYKDDFLKVYHAGIAQNTLGPGKRLAIWVSGCNHRCPGCIEQRLWNSDSGKDIHINELFARIENLFEEINGITFTGGEPLLQYKALSGFIDLLPPKLDKMLFTGFENNELSIEQNECLSKFSLVCLGRFKEDLTGSFLWRGSSNQRFFSPDLKYNKSDIELFHKSISAGLEVIEDNGKLFFYGIPTEFNEIESITDYLCKNDIVLGN